MNIIYIVNYVQLSCLMLSAHFTVGLSYTFHHGIWWKPRECSASSLNFWQRFLFWDVACCLVMFLYLLVPLISLSYNKVSGWVCQPLIQVPQSLDIQVERFLKHVPVIGDLTWGSLTRSLWFMESDIRLPSVICAALSHQKHSFPGGECSSELLYSEKAIMYFFRCTSFLASKIVSIQVAWWEIQYTHPPDLIIIYSEIKYIFIKMSPPPILHLGAAHRIAAAATKSLHSCPTLCDSIDGSPPGSAVPGILQARTLEWVAISFSNTWKWKVRVKSLSRVWPSVTPWSAAYQAPLSIGFSRQEYWSGVPLPSPKCC